MEWEKNTAKNKDIDRGKRCTSLAENQIICLIVLFYYFSVGFSRPPPPLFMFVERFSLF